MAYCKNTLQIIGSRFNPSLKYNQLSPQAAMIYKIS